MKNKRLITLFVLTMITSSACSYKTSNINNSSNQVIKVNISANPKTLDPGLNYSTEGQQVICNTFEGLTDLDKNDNPIPGVAESWNISKDGLTYTFKLRENAKWSDGKPVTAKDFEYAWKRVLAPETASQSAYQLYYLKNGKSFNQKKCSKNDVGVKAINNSTLAITLENPTTYFLSLIASGPYMPVREDIVSKNKNWALNPNIYISNGAFKLKNYNSGNGIDLEKNTKYWDSKDVKLNKIEMKTLDNSASYTAAFKTGQLDIIDAPSPQEAKNLLKDGTAKVYPYLGSYYYYINLSENAQKINPKAAKVLQDVRVRKALSIAIDRKTLVEKVIQSGEKPATSLVPSSVLINGNKFKNKDYYSETADIKEAKKLLIEAGYPNGQGFPKLELLYNSGQGHKDIAEAVQEMWRKNLGINITLRNVERKVQLTDLKNHNYLLCRGGWIADYNDPVAFLDLFTTNNEQNNSVYSNSKFDQLISSAKKEPDVKKRISLLHSAEDIIMTDLPVIPLYEYTEEVCINKKIKDVHISRLGFFLFRDAYIQ